MYEMSLISFTVSHYVHAVLRAVLKLHASFMVTPEPVPDDCDDNRWKWFKGCLGPIDGTYINVHVPNADKHKYRSRKGQICTNTLAVCDRRLRFTYVLAGWEGSAADARILLNAITRPNDFKIALNEDVISGNYYLCDNGYANCDGFLASYKSARYHLKEWGPATEAPQTSREIFNMQHTRARNVIERAFAVLKMCWGILRTASYYHVKIQTWLIITCFLLHNYIRSEMPTDPIEMTENDEFTDNKEAKDDGDLGEFVNRVEPSPAWNDMRVLP
ncbi:putative nuclease HARBI1 [Salvia splendens]|uniref:putative nuclease HARBI1 n=1 Tax=Salvia splendens TaxID=180675 RepID=UPI001C263073|nr:putative nuclease HARBI1 [Salvia splendens]